MQTGSKIENLSTTVGGESRELHLLLFNFLCNLNRAPYKWSLDCACSSISVRNVGGRQLGHRGYDRIELCQQRLLTRLSFEMLRRRLVLCALLRWCKSLGASVSSYAYDGHGVAVVTPEKKRHRAMSDAVAPR